MLHQLVSRVTKILCLSTMTWDFDMEEKFDILWSQMADTIDEIFDSYRLLPGFLGTIVATISNFSSPCCCLNWAPPQTSSLPTRHWNRGIIECSIMTLHLIRISHGETWRNPTAVSQISQDLAKFGSNRFIGL